QSPKPAGHGRIPQKTCCSCSWRTSRPEKVPFSLSSAPQIRLATPTPHALRRDDGSYIVEHREGDAEHHYGTVAPDMRSAHRLLTGWAFKLPGWKDRATWSPVAPHNCGGRARAN